MRSHVFGWGLAALLLTGCDSSSATKDDNATGTDADVVTPELVIPAEFVNGHVDFEDKHVLTQAYWYSRYNLGSLVMKSGLGETFMPEMSMVTSMVGMVSDDLSTAVPPSSPALLKRVFNTGNPYYANPADDNNGDFLSERWIGGDSTATTGQAYGWTVIKEVEWAKQFHVDAHFGVVGDSDIPGAQQRFAGLVLFAEAFNQTMELMNAPDSFDLSGAQNSYVALMAVAEMAIIIEPSVLPHSASNRYKMMAASMAESMGTPEVDFAVKFATAADDMYAILPDATSIEDRATAIQALAFYGVASATNRDAVKTKIAEHADALVAATASTTLERAAAVHGLISAQRALGSDAWKQDIVTAYADLLSGYEGELALFSDIDTYSTADIGLILRALNGVSLYSFEIEPELSLQLIRDVFENLVNVSGLQISAPPVTMLPEYERMPAPAAPESMFHRYEAMSVPPAAGGDNGVAPVSAATVSYDRAAKTWSASNDAYDTAGAMRLANEMLWLHADEVDGFPEVP